LEAFAVGSLGIPELIVLFGLALLIFGPRKLPELGKTLGKSLAEFRKATTDLRTSWEEEVRTETDKLKKDVESIDPTSGDPWSK
jgi:TatA/E family protein of Tat protein translocase